MKRTLSLLLFALFLLLSKAASATTWYVRADGGTRFDANNPTGQCNGQHDAAYSGDGGVNENCAFGDFRLLYDDQHTYNQFNWAIKGGDTVVIDNTKQWRIGWDTNNGQGEQQCIGGMGNAPYSCNNPTIPAGTAQQHTRFIGRCVLNENCNTGNTTNRTNLSQLFGGHGVGSVLNLASTQYVDVEGLELTSHNGQCIGHGSPAYPSACNTGIPISDYDSNGIGIDNNANNILLQDVYIHGHINSGIQGPIGANITLNRVFIGFNGFAGWNFDDGNSTPDGPNASIAASYVTMEGNGCNEEYPIVHTQFPAVSCYDLNSGGFGDSWSGQNTTMTSFTCNHCIMAYNTKDGFIGPHTGVTTLSVTDSASFGNMGQQWKWGTNDNSSTLFANNFTIGDCNRMSEQIPGAPYNYNQNKSSYPGAHLSLFCRAAGDVFSFYSSANSSVLFANNMVIAYSPTIFDMNCNDNCTNTPYTYKNNIFLGFTNSDPLYLDVYSSGQAPAVYYYSAPTDAVVASNNVEYGVRNGDNCGGTIHCSDPLLVDEPANPMLVETALDSLNFTLASGSPAIGNGVTLAGIATDFAGAALYTPPTIGPLEYGSSATLSGLLLGESSAATTTTTPTTPTSPTTPVTTPTTPVTTPTSPTTPATPTSPTTPTNPTSKALAATKTVLSASKGSSASNPLLLTATVTVPGSASNHPQGVVLLFASNNTPLGAGVLNANGTMSWLVSSNLANYTVHAVYVGSATDATSTSNGLNEAQAIGSLY